MIHARRSMAMVCVTLTLAAPLASASLGAAVDSASLIAQGAIERSRGNLNVSIDLLSSARQSATSDDMRARASCELGASLLQAHRLDEAESALREGHAGLAALEKARCAIDLGNLATLRKQTQAARTLYREALELAGDDSAIAVGAELDLARIAPERERGSLLTSLSRKVGSIADASAQARYRLNLGDQARRLGSASAQLAYENLEQARRLALQVGDGRLLVESLDALAQLYEDGHRPADALTLTRQALRLAREEQQGRELDLIVNLEWRQGRLAKDAGNRDLALAAYQRAVEGLEAIRQDMPIEQLDGESSFRATLEPIYLGLAGELFQKASQQRPGDRLAYLSRIRDVVELIRQSELQDYLGDRCEVEAIHNDKRAILAPGVAVLYPITFPDRTELILVTDEGIAWRTMQVRGGLLRGVALEFASDLRAGKLEYAEHARRLYDWLLRPFEDQYARVDVLVVVPDGALRLVPFAALHDGSRFAIEKFAIATVTGLTMTSSDPPSGRTIASLVAGIAHPGPVVDKLSQLSATRTPGVTNGIARGTRTRAIGTARLRAPGAAEEERARQTADLRESLALPGVKDEIEGIGRILKGTRLLDADFTVGRFQKEAESGDYRIVHIASHGVFGGSANSSFILAYDDVLTMNGLQALLRSEHVQKTPIEILSLSACETAEGDDRSPLGISGAAIKARARSVVGTLWPVDDTSARTVMEGFYAGLTSGNLSKARALQKAQVELIRQPRLSHPFFWAPFTLIGNWQ